LYFVISGYAVLVVNYRGSIGYGQDSISSLLGNIGINDVDDVANLTLKCLNLYPEIVDQSRVGITGGSHGGYLTGWMIGHPKYNQIWKAAAARNPVFNLNYMLAATEIPDWIFACTKNSTDTVFLS